MIISEAFLHTMHDMVVSKRVFINRNSSLLEATSELLPNSCTTRGTIFSTQGKKKTKILYIFFHEKNNYVFIWEDKITSWSVTSQKLHSSVNTMCVRCYSHTAQWTAVCYSTYLIECSSHCTEKNPFYYFGLLQILESTAAH